MNCFACDEQEASGTQSPAIEHTCGQPQDRHAGRVSKGGPPPATTVEDLLAFNDSTLGAFIVATMSIEPKIRQFEALGRILRAGAREDLEFVLGRRRR